MGPAETWLLLAESYTGFFRAASHFLAGADDSRKKGKTDVR